MAETHKHERQDFLIGFGPPDCYDDRNHPHPRPRLEKPGRNLMVEGRLRRLRRPTACHWADHASIASAEGSSVALDDYALARLASLSDSGYAASREQAFADFRARWEFK